jgi:putative thioredoxin
MELADDDESSAGLAAIEAGDIERGLQHLLDAVRRAQGESRDRIRQVMVGVFADLGQDDPLATRYRRELARTLY